MANNVDERVIVNGTPEQRAALVLWLENHYDSETTLGKIYSFKSVASYTEEDFQGFYLIDLVVYGEKDQTILTFWSKWGTREELWNHVIKTFGVELWVYSKDATNDDFTLYHGTKNGWILIESGHYLEMYYVEKSAVVQKAQKMLEENNLKGPAQIQYSFRYGIKYEEMDSTKYYIKTCVEILSRHKVENNLLQEYKLEQDYELEKSVEYYKSIGLDAFIIEEKEKPKESSEDEFNDYITQLEAKNEL